MTLLILGLALFFATHSVAIVNEPWRNAMVARLGEGPWKGLYSLASFAGLLLIVKGYAAARVAPIVLWTPPAWLTHLTLLLMIVVFPLLLATYLPGRIKTATKHPLLSAVKFWALAHLLANGTLADVLLFGGFLLWAGIDRVSVKYRAPRKAPAAPASKHNDLIVLVGGLALYFLFIFWAHEALFGVKPLAALAAG
jgi:uncharacterized membrane protein